MLLAITTLSYGAAEALTGMAMLAAGVTLLLGFIWVEIRSGAPLLDLQLFKIREFAAGNIARLLNALAWLGMMLIVSFYMQVVLDFTPIQTGMGLLPLECPLIQSGA